MNRKKGFNIKINSEDKEIKVGTKTLNELSQEKRDKIFNIFRELINKNTKLSEYEHDSMWMSYRYCIGRHTIAAHAHAYDIWKNCRGRLSKENELFNAYDINREIEQQLAFYKPNFYFPLTSLNRIYTTAVDIVCEFIQDYNIKSKEDLLKYKDVHVILSDNERGYKIETVTWEEYLRSKVISFLKKFYGFDKLNEENLWKRFLSWKNKEDINLDNEIIKYFEEITKDMPNPEYYWMFDLEDLFVWNDLVHCFDHEHHHKSILIDGSECIWFWTWTHKYDENGYRTFGYEKIRVPLDKWSAHVTTWINDNMIKENIY